MKNHTTMNTIAIIGYGHIGRAAEQAVRAAHDMELVGIYHHNDDLSTIAADAVLVCTPTREVQAYAEKFLQRGIVTVDSFDIHGFIPALRRDLGSVAQAHNTTAVISAGWDPGSDSVVRCLMQALAPQGMTYTDFGPGRSMGHTVAAKAIAGIKDALSMTIPLGTGIHRRMVYIELAEGADFEEVKQALLADDYFCHDETHVIAVDSVAAIDNVAHGVHISRLGVSGETHNQHISFDMSINNPALTGQVMVAAARAALRLKAEQRYGAYTMIEIPPVYLLEGSTEDNVKKLV